MKACLLIESIPASAKNKRRRELRTPARRTRGVGKAHPRQSRARGHHGRARGGDGGWGEGVFQATPKLPAVPTGGRVEEAWVRGQASSIGTRAREGRAAGPLQKCLQPRERGRFGLNRLARRCRPNPARARILHCRRTPFPTPARRLTATTLPTPPRPAPHLTHGPPAAAAIFARESQPRPHARRPRDRAPPD